MLSESMRAFFDENGYVVARALFDSQEVDRLREHYMELRAQGAHPGDMVGVDTASSDPLKRFPRMIHMHHWDETSLSWLLEPRLNEVLTGLLEREPYAVQTMLYFKPAGARGQALHQDQYFLRARPGTCMAAWLALDDCDEANGCMQVIPGSHTWPLLCTTQADTKNSFTDVTVPLPEGQEVQPIVMQAGDVLFFNGTLVHGSYPNTSSDRFRRSLIGHYISGEAEQASQFMKPILRMDGSEVDLEASLPGGPCGVWVEEDGKPVIELSGLEINTVFCSE
ncbi:protein involved in biosynthesis of mitomycin antibiotics/polyketide fumonisin [Ktedonobacter sp. SOSP1-85]|uniref:phytanoyl-CoA dioxygenase family protein n=1 Tax=Ktedonobacter sp. SOSP1-85 TaxID=2778367 RepID=UPI00191570ED|nr:phytanoyl-CoA dioxygenase family protein [Ktedonobacter sp. SOSP1-85]GHO79155.1 protein involved in biosynthesis of mitomycin antibiotics/polyketide fumonisin [Ktedonobacter sp. SOSP1-85]